jgi:hypothetical protein
MYRPHKEKKKNLDSIKKEVNNFLKKIYWKPVTIILYFFRTYIIKRKSRDNFISLVCISKNRSLKLQKAIEHLIENTKNINLVELNIFIDSDDNEITHYKNIIEKNSSKMSIYLEIGNIEKNTAKINYLCKKSKGNILWGFNDDMFLESNWDLEINKEANKFNENEAYCLWANEKGIKYNYLHCNAPAISKKWFEICGYYLNEKLYHYYADNWLCDLSRGSYKFLITNKKIWKHKNVDSYLDLYDKTYDDLKKKSIKYDEKNIYINLKQNKNHIINKLKKNII